MKAFILFGWQNDGYWDVQSCCSILFKYCPHSLAIHRCFPRVGPGSVLEKIRIRIRIRIWIWIWIWIRFFDQDEAAGSAGEGAREKYRVSEKNGPLRREEGWASEEGGDT